MTSGSHSKAPTASEISHSATGVPSATLDEALRESERRFRDLFEHASDGVFIADLDGRFIDVNSAGCRMLGRAREELVGKRIVDFIPPEAVRRLWDAREQLLKGDTQGLGVDSAAQRRNLRTG